MQFLRFSQRPNVDYLPRTLGQAVNRDMAIRMQEEESSEFIPVGALLEELRRQAQSNEHLQSDSATTFTRQAPHSADAERGVLCGILLDGDRFEEANTEGLKADDFYHPTHGAIFAAMQNLHHNGEPINTTTVVDELLRLQKLDQVGGAPFLAQLEALVPTSAHTASYARIIKEKSTLRRLITVATNVVASAYRQDRRVPDVIDEAERTILEIRDAASTKGMIPIQALVWEGFKKIEQLHQNKGVIGGISSGFRDFDRLTNGLQPGELLIIAARPSMGKTAFTLNIAAHVAIKQRAPVGFFSLEMGADQLVQRLIGAEAGIDLSLLRRGELHPSQIGEIANTCGTISNAPLYIDETASLTISEMRNKCRRLAHQHGVKLIMVDYLQLMDGPQGYDNKAAEVAEISKGLKTIARELKVPVIALSQLNRGVESRTDKRPMMSDLRESGAIEQDADVIAFLYREEYYLRDKTPSDQLGTAEVIIAKNRNGPTGVFHLKFFSNQTRFSDLDTHH
jgi:replicative DNA helicase